MPTFKATDQPMNVAHARFIYRTLEAQIVSTGHASMSRFLYYKIRTLQGWTTIQRRRKKKKGHTPMFIHHAWY